MLDSISNEPAGRLREVLSTVRSIGDGRTLSNIWEEAALAICPARGDALSVRAEAGALYSAVETAINSLTADHDREAFRAYRHTWARPIFGIGLIDSSTHQLSGANIVSNEAIHTLSMLSSTLRSEAPEPRPRLSHEQLKEQLQEIYDTLGSIHAEVSVASWFDRRARGRLLHLITSAMDSIVFIELRGFGSLERSVLTVEGELISAEGQLSSPNELPDQLRIPWLERIETWLSQIRPIVRHVREMVEYDFLPLAGGISVGMATGEVPAALGAWIASRVALEGRHAAPPLSQSDQQKMLPPSEPPEEDAGQSADGDEAAS